MSAYRNVRIVVNGSPRLLTLTPHTAILDGTVKSGPLEAADIEPLVVGILDPYSARVDGIEEVSSAAAYDVSITANIEGPFANDRVRALLEGLDTVERLRESLTDFRSWLFRCSAFHLFARGVSEQMTDLLMPQPSNSEPLEDIEWLKSISEKLKE